MKLHSEMVKSAFGPVNPSDRIVLLDVLRGIALFGVLYVNMHNFASDNVTGALHETLRFFMVAVFAGKFFSLFSLLFGMGFAIQLQRAQTRDAPFTRIYVRRLTILFAFGLLHTMIYPGDILRLYAILGLLLLPMSNCSPRRLLILAVVIFAVDYASWYVFRSNIVQFDLFESSTAITDSIQATGSEPSEPTIDEQEIVESERERIYETGSFWEVVLTNLTWYERWRGLVLNHGLQALSLFLLGFAIVRSALLTRIEAHRPKVRRFMWIMFCLGIPGALITAYVAGHGSEGMSILMKTLGSGLGKLSPPILALAYSALIALQSTKSGWRRALEPFGAVGRMALTMYIFQSIIYTGIYYGYGLGMYGQLGPAHILLLAPAVFSLEVVICNWWLERYRFGPFEWLWRTLTYRQVQPLRIIHG